MSSVFDDLLSKNLLNTPPHFLKNNIHYEVVTGSVAYGCNTPGMSDKDIVGFAIPPKEVIFPTLAGKIPGFDKQDLFNQYQMHHIKHPSGMNYDITIYNIVQFFSLCMDNNPNMIDCLYPPRQCILHTTAVGECVRENADKFLTKHCFHKFNGYAHSQLHKMQSKVIKEFVEYCQKWDVDVDVTIPDLDHYDRLPEQVISKFRSYINIVDKDGKRTKRVKTIQKYGYDVKFAYHLVRLQSECEQILVNHTLDLQRDREIYKSIRRGEWSEGKIIQHFQDNELRLRKVYDESALRERPDVVQIRQILLNCLEMHYGSMEQCVVSLDKYQQALKEIKQIIINNKI
jgi:hypothetical protein